MTNEIETKIPQQITLLRSRFGWTQQELADRIGFSKQTISNWETGLKVPRMGAIQRMSDLFGVSISFIIDGDDITPDWADENDILDLKEMLENNVNMAYGGEELTDEEKQRVKDVLTGIFWEKNKQRKDK
ncbi:helix-turn-helix transcriptional regulator [Carnobacterium sp. ISL-102]|uniref:helix-turn-helix domain-containing protein n=1 Tax=Carnobacterium sp. ISL-102 TaxID=2819142 RepID=UPI001BE5B75A|nr:helix-turn-helix transcriptional regulator [Carnobacterium sp. ISL-102]MBT2732082.1 helix-turn-helix transcriptional regulator [Carnobacterium sp. ISL-102]